MAYVSLYRKYRSQSFDELIGQNHVVRTLQNAITQGKIAHAYLFTGPRGTGKTSTARLLAKALCCVNGPTPTPCNVCEMCVAITQGNAMDVFEIDAASESGVDDVRETIVEGVSYMPTEARYKVYIIDEVHDLSRQAFDALLKTIEEPPEHCIFILATTEYNRVPPTIRSRCQKYEFHRATLADLEKRLNTVLEGEGGTAEPAAIAAIARMADGGYRDALTLLEQALITAEGPVTLAQVYDQLGLVNESLVDELLVAMKTQDVPEILRCVSEVIKMGRDARALLESMLHRLAELTLAAFEIAGNQGDKARDAAMFETAVRIGKDTILRYRGEIAGLHQDIREVSLPRVWLESKFIHISRESDATPKAAAQQQVHATKPVQPTVRAVQEEPPKRQEEKPVAPIVEKAVAEVPELPPVDPALEEQDRVWKSAAAKLSQASPAMKLRLAACRVVSFKDNVIGIEVSGQMNLDWIKSSPKSPKIIAAIIDEVKAVSGKDWVVEFQLKAAGPEPAFENERPAEVALEGEALERALRAGFSQNN